MDHYAEIYPEAVRLFGSAMQRELVANRYKGHWAEYDRQKLWTEMEHHVSKLFKAVDAIIQDEVAPEGESSDWLKNRVLEFAADVGNCALFVADNLGVLTNEQVELRKNEPDFMENTYENDERPPDV